MTPEERWKLQGRISQLELENANLKRELIEKAEELRITDELLANRNRVMEAIPECELHGHQCVPHALDWIELAKRIIAEKQNDA